MQSTYYGWTLEQLQAVGVTSMDWCEAISGCAVANKKILQVIDQWHKKRRYPPGASPIVDAEGRNY